MLRFVGEAEAEVIATFAWQHLKAARTFRDDVCRLELENFGREFGSFFVDIRSYCTGVVLAAVASLEAHINELFIAPKGPLRGLIGDFEKEFWGERGIERKPILKKYNRALQLLAEPQLDEQGSAYQGAFALIELRNSFVHFKPTWNPKEHRRENVERLLAGKFNLSPFVGVGADFVSKRSMSAGCAKWAFQSVLDFLRDFHGRGALQTVKMQNFWKLDT